MFDDLGVECRATGDRAYRIEDILILVRQLRPYIGVSQCGESDFRFQSYLITHLLFVVASWGGSSWGAHPLPRAVLADEFVFLLGNISTAIELQDPELVGEFLHCLRLFGVPETDPRLRTGCEFLRSVEAGPTRRGTWVPERASYYKRYHAAFCGVLGLMPIVFDAPTVSAPVQPPFRSQRKLPDLLHILL